MLRYIAFLRAINVGGHIVKMDHLRRLFESLGNSNVETFIASGNVIFESPAKNARALESEIENHLKKSLGYKVATFIRSPEEILQIARYEPFETYDLEVEGNSLYIVFVTNPPDEAARKKLMAYKNPIDDFHVNGREIYWLCRKKISESSFSGSLLEKTIGMPATMRNSTTVKKSRQNLGVTSDK